MPVIQAPTLQYILKGLSTFSLAFLFHFRMHDSHISSAEATNRMKASILRRVFKLSCCGAKPMERSRAHQSFDLPVYPKEQVPFQAVYKK